MGGSTVQTNESAVTPADAGVHRARFFFLQTTAIVVLANVVTPVAAPAQTTLPDINVIATTPLSGTRSPQRSTAPAAPSRPARVSRPAPAATPSRGTATRSTAPAPARTAAAPAPAPAQAAPPADSSMIDRDKVPSNTQVLTSEDFSHDKAPTFLDGLSQSLPGVFIGDQSGNQFQRDVNYRGFVASPVQGTPQGLAVYQNGVRINESYGDVVNWDFIPEMAIRKLSLVPNSPIFGLNAIGGALTIEMKNGFTYQGKEAETMVGSYGRRQAAAQAGYQDGNLSAYVNADAINDNGWRDFSSASQLRRIYTDIGARNDTTEVHLNFTGADNKLGSVAATPLDMLSQRWSSVYTWPQSTHLQLAFTTLSLNHEFSDTLSFQSNGYYRGFWQAHTDGNGTDGQPCDPLGALAGQLCIGDGLTPINVGYSVIDTLPGSAFLGEIDRNWTSTNSFGGTAQVTSSDKFFGHENHFVMGMSLDRGLTNFTGTSELGTIDQNLFVQGTGVYINQPGDDIAPVNLFAKNTYTGVYATDTIDITSQLSVTAGARFNIAQIDLLDQTFADPLLNSASHYQRTQPGDRRDLQDHAQHDRLCRLLRGEPGADAARTRLLEPHQPLHHRQLPDRRPAPQAGDRDDLRGRVARQRGHQRPDRPDELGARDVLYAVARRHHQHRRLAADDRLFPECRQHPAGRHRGEDQLQAGPLDHLRQLHLYRRDVPPGAAHLIAQRPVRGRQRQHLRRARRPHPGHSQRSGSRPASNMPSPTPGSSAST